MKTTNYWHKIANCY